MEPLGINKIHRSLTASPGVTANPTHKLRANKQTIAIESPAGIGYSYYVFPSPRVTAHTGSRGRTHAATPHRALANLALCRVTRRGAGTFDRVVRGYRLMRAAGVKPYALCVVDRRGRVHSRSCSRPR